MSATPYAQDHAALQRLTEPQRGFFGRRYPIFYDDAEYLSKEILAPGERVLRESIAWQQSELALGIKTREDNRLTHRLDWARRKSEKADQLNDAQLAGDHCWFEVQGLPQFDGAFDWQSVSGQQAFNDCLSISSSEFNVAFTGTPPDPLVCYCKVQDDQALQSTLHNMDYHGMPITDAPGFANEEFGRVNDRNKKFIDEALGAGRGGPVCPAASAELPYRLHLYEQERLAPNTSDSRSQSRAKQVKRQQVKKLVAKALRDPHVAKVYHQKVDRYELSKLKSQLIASLTSYRDKQDPSTAQAASHVLDVLSAPGFDEQEVDDEVIYQRYVDVYTGLCEAEQILNDNQQDSVVRRLQSILRKQFKALETQGSPLLRAKLEPVVVRFASQRTMAEMTGKLQDFRRDKALARRHDPNNVNYRLAQRFLDFLDPERSRPVNSPAKEELSQLFAMLLRAEQSILGRDSSLWWPRFLRRSYWSKSLAIYRQVRRAIAKFSLKSKALAASLNPTMVMRRLRQYALAAETEVKSVRDGLWWRLIARMRRHHGANLDELAALAVDLRLKSNRHRAVSNETDLTASYTETESQQAALDAFKVLFTKLVSVYLDILSGSNSNLRAGRRDWFSADQKLVNVCDKLVWQALEVARNNPLLFNQIRNEWFRLIRAKNKSRGEQLITAMQTSWGSLDPDDINASNLVKALLEDVNNINERRFVDMIPERGDLGQAVRRVMQPLLRSDERHNNAEVQCKVLLEIFVALEKSSSFRYLLKTRSILRELIADLREHSPEVLPALPCDNRGAIATPRRTPDSPAVIAQGLMAAAAQEPEPVAATSQIGTPLPPPPPAEQPARRTVSPHVIRNLMEDPAFCDSDSDVEGDGEDDALLPPAVAHYEGGVPDGEQEAASMNSEATRWIQDPRDVGAVPVPVPG